MFCMFVFLTAFLKLKFCSLLNKVMYNAINAYAEDYRYVMPYFCHYHISPCQNKGASWSWSYGSCIYNYLCNECLSSLKLWVRNPVICFVQNFFFRQPKNYNFFFQNLTLGYMTKTLNQIIFFFLHQNQNIFFSNIGNQNIFLEKTYPPPLQVKWSFP
jgi:hypothetical protein